MSTDLVLLAVLMFAVTYPTRALGLLTPGLERLPRRALDYLQLVGPAVLTAIAAVNVMVVTEGAGAPSFHVGIEWVAVLVCLAITAWRKNLLLGLVAGGGHRRDRSGDRSGGDARLTRAGSAPPRLRLDLDQQARVDQRGDRHHRRRRPDLPEDLAVDGRQRRRVGDVRDEHPGPDDVPQARSHPRPAPAR